ncbi:MAG: transglutaminase family protein [Planctomycetes bacterium]|nr:transglutaminase family protein [Planctomycetota bacterium]
MIYRITHVNTYRYSEPVTSCQNLAHLSPRETPRQTSLQSQILVQPSPAVMSSRQDYFGNPVSYFAVQEPHRSLTVTATSQVQLRPEPTPEPALTPPWDDLACLRPRPGSPEDVEASPFRFDSQYVERHADLASYARPSFLPGRPILDAVLDFTRRIHAEFRYDKTATTTATPVLEVLRHRHGVCQDFAHLQIGGLRSLGISARYVSGYLLTTPPPGLPRLLGADASHAWVSFYCPGFGWIDIDPTNNAIPGDRHITFAWGRDYDDVCPLKGVILGGGKQVVDVGVSVVPVDAAEKDDA